MTRTHRTVENNFKPNSRGLYPVCRLALKLGGIDPAQVAKVILEYRAGKREAPPEEWFDPRWRRRSA
jgi:hypothetical protein